MAKKKVYEKIFIITNHQENANQSHHEISPHPRKKGHYEKDER
jgi:hypothetical protein